ncbi:MAG TPA: transposase [Actinomycetota bacterium]|nr:transposase [Actinomycetota bacterium]
MVKSVHRTARIALRATPGQTRRCFALMIAAGDVWAWVMECNRQLRTWGQRPVVNYQALCRELAGNNFGELAQHSARRVLERYSTAWFAAAQRRRAGQHSGFPRRKRRLFAVIWQQGNFAIDKDRIRLAVARGSRPLTLRLGRDLLYPQEALRTVTLIHEAGRLYLDVTALIPVETHELDKGKVCGVDLGIIHPFALASGTDALVVSGRALRAEERLHLSDTKARAKKMGRRAPKKGQRGSRRYRKLRATQKRAEARHKRRIRQAHHEAAKQVVGWAIDHRVGRLAIGDPKGITAKDSGRKQNLRLHQWRRTHLVQALKDKAEVAGIEVSMVDERGTSSTCPDCRSRVSKPKGRNFLCHNCGLRAHRDIVGARNIAGRLGGITSTNMLVTHRRAGTVAARRDRRRHLLDERRSGPAPGRPGTHAPGSRSAGRRRDGAASCAATAPQAGVDLPPGEDQEPSSNGAEVV